VNAVPGVAEQAVRSSRKVPETAAISWMALARMAVMFSYRTPWGAEGVVPASTVIKRGSIFATSSAMKRTTVPAEAKGRRSQFGPRLRQREKSRVD
jgi:hypothetical protein